MNVHGKDVISPQKCPPNKWQYFDENKHEFIIDELLCVEEGNIYFQSKNVMLLYE